MCSSRYEGFSTFAMECMVLGKAFVTTECSGMREILGDSEYGLIVQNQDEAFYTGIKRCVIDNETRALFAGRALLRGKDFTTKKLVKALEEHFIELVGG